MHGLEDTMLPRTTFLCRLIGLWALIVSLAFLLHRASMAGIATDLGKAPALLFITGAFTGLAGLAVVLAHNVWTGGVAPVVVTLVGWLLLIKGSALLIISPDGMSDLLAVSRFGEYAYFYVAIPLILGLYLTYAGFLTDHAKPPARF